MRSRLHLFSRLFAGPRQRYRIAWPSTEAAELLEFALLLPVLLVMIVGLMDFATAFNLKQKLANAAREGARLAASQPRSDLDTTSCSSPSGPVPCSILSIKDDVTTYLQQAGVDTSFITDVEKDMSYDPATPCTATFYKANSSPGGANYGLKIERCIPFVGPDGSGQLETRVTLTYPYNWTYGFNHVISLLFYYFFQAGTLPGTISIETDATMIDLT